MPLPRLYRFNDLKAAGVVSNREQLSRLIERHGFPCGKLISPNIRVWAEDEIEVWLQSRPEGTKAPLRGAAAGWGKAAAA
jgi:hypothetical protein